MEVVASLSQGRTAAAQCGLFTYKSFPVIFEPPCISAQSKYRLELSSMQNFTKRKALSVLTPTGPLSFKRFNFLPPSLH